VSATQNVKQSDSQMQS